MNHSEKHPSQKVSILSQNSMKQPPKTNPAGSNKSPEAQVEGPGLVGEISKIPEIGFVAGGS